MWQQTLSKELKIGLSQSSEDDCLFYRGDEDNIFVLVVHVDDILIAYNNSEWLIEVIEKLRHKFKLKDLGYPKNFLGLEINKNESGELTISQKSYINDIIERFRMTDSKTIAQ